MSSGCSAPTSRELVDGVTKLSRIELDRPDRHQAGGKFPQAGAGDVERHPRAAGQARRPPAQHADARPSSAIRRSASASPRETLEIYAPLAERIGMQKMQDELEDLAFAELDPDARDTSIGAHVVPARRPMAAWSAASPDEIKRNPRRARAATPASRAARRRAYSIWRKMQRKNVAFEQLSDILAFRVMVGSVERLLSGAGRHPRPLAHRARPLQGLHLDTEAERLPLHPYHGDRPGAAADRDPDPHQRHA